MAERIESVESGGLRKFSYDKGYNPKLDETRKLDIKKGYEEYYIRRAREKRNKIIGFAIVGLIVIGIVVWVIFSS